MIGTELALERMKKTGTQGTILNTASMAGIAPGLSVDMLAYSVSKHGVVCLTRTLNVGYKETGVEVKALCPAWTDTEIVSGVKTNKAGVDATVKKMGGLMTVEHVAEGFYSLLTECPRGSCMAVVKGVPFFIIPDVSFSMVTILATLALFTSKITGVMTVQVGHF